MKELGVLLFAAIVAMGILLIVLLLKISRLKHQTDDIVSEVKAYVEYITQQEEINTASEWGYGQTMRAREHDKNYKSENDCTSRDERESLIIQAVLGDFFP